MTEFSITLRFGGPEVADLLRPNIGGDLLEKVRGLEEYFTGLSPAIVLFAFRFSGEITDFGRSGVGPAQFRKGENSMYVTVTVSGADIENGRTMEMLAALIPMALRKVVNKIESENLGGDLDQIGAEAHLSSFFRSDAP